MKKTESFLLTIIFLFILVGCSHIEDTNGTDDHSLVTLTDADFLRGYSSGVSNMSVSKTVNEMTSFSVKKFSGISVLERKIRASGEDLEIRTDTGLASGNLRICVVRDNEEIVAEIDVNGKEVRHLDVTRVGNKARIDLTLPALCGKIIMRSKEA